MATMTLRLEDKEAELVRKYAKFEGKSISDFIRDAVFERIEDYEDLALVEAAIAEDDGTRYTLEEVKKELGI